MNAKPWIILSFFETLVIEMFGFEILKNKNKIKLTMGINTILTLIPYAI